MKRKEIEFKFILENPDVEKRKLECDKIINLCPEKIPIICEKDPECHNLEQIDKTKFLVANDLTVAQFYYVIRKKLNVNKEESAFYLLVYGANGIYAITGDILLSQIYEKHKNPEDGFLYFIYTSQIVWGAE